MRITIDQLWKDLNAQADAFQLAELLAQIDAGEASPEKAGVGGSTPSLATILLLNLASVRSAFWFRLVPIH